MNFLDSYRTMRRVLGVCPCCGDLFRLTDVEISYRRAAKADWFDELEQELERLQKLEESIRDREKEGKERQAERGRREIPGLVRRAAPSIARLGFQPQEIKALFHPVDLIAFDGLRQEQVRKVVLLDAECADGARKRLQGQLRHVVERGEFHWETVNVADDGTVGTKKG